MLRNTSRDMALKVFYKRRGGEEGGHHTGSEAPGAQGLSCHHLQHPEQHDHRRHCVDACWLSSRRQRPRVEGGQRPGGSPAL